MTGAIDLFSPTGVVNVSASEDYWSPALDHFELENDHANGMYPRNPFHLDPSAGAGTGVLHPSMIVLLVVGTAALLAAIFFLLLKWQRRRYQDCPWNSGQLTYFYPYIPSS